MIDKGAAYLAGVGANEVSDGKRQASVFAARELSVT